MKVRFAHFSSGVYVPALSYVALKEWRNALKNSTHAQLVIKILSLKYAINWTINIEVGDFFYGGVYLRPTDPLDPLEGVLGGHLLENSDPLGPP